MPCESIGIHLPARTVPADCLLLRFETSGAELYLIVGYDDRAWPVPVTPSTPSPTEGTR